MDTFFYSLDIQFVLLRSERIHGIRKSVTCYMGLYYAHTNRFFVVQENIKPEVLEVQTELARFL